MGHQIVIRRLLGEYKTGKKADPAISRVIRIEEFILRPDGASPLLCR